MFSIVKSVLSTVSMSAVLASSSLTIMEAVVGRKVSGCGLHYSIVTIRQEHNSALVGLVIIAYVAKKIVYVRACVCVHECIFFSDQCNLSI